MTQKIWLPKNIRTAFSIENKKESVKPKRKQGQIQETRICVNCEIPFLAEYPNQVYCEKCRSDYRKKKVEEVTKPRKCVKCGEEFTPTRISTNRQCKGNSGYNRTICRPCARKHERRCLSCGKKLFNRLQFCSEKCQFDQFLKNLESRKKGILYGKKERV